MSEMDGKLDWRKKWKQRVTIANLAWADFAAWAWFSLLSPFYPHEARLKGVPPSLVGFLFGVYELVIFLTAPLFGMLANKIGHKFLFVSGVFVCSICSVLFGLLVYCPPGGVYIAMCFLSISIEALGASAFMTASYTLAAKEYPEKFYFIVGILETCAGVGLMVGPLIGGAFYDLGGVGLPCYVMGGVLFFTAVVAYVTLNEESQSKVPESVPIRKLLCDVRIIIVTLTVMTSTSAWEFLDPTLADRLKPFGLSTALVGLTFFLCPAIYAFSSPVWGWLADKYGNAFLYLVIGNLAFTVCFLLLGPAPFLDLPFTLWLNIVSLCFMGFCAGCTLIMAYRAFVDISLDLGFEEDLATYGCIAGIYNSAMSLGSFLGTTFGGMLETKLGFDWACVAFAILFLPVSLVSLVSFIILPKCCGVKNSKRDSQTNEKLTLLSSWTHSDHTKPTYSEPSNSS